MALAGNPLTIKPWEGKAAQNGDKAGQKMREIKYGDIRMGDKLGEGASGQVFKGDWDGKEVAVKVFKGEITSDGLPECEMDAMVAAGGAHPNLPKVIKAHPFPFWALICNPLKRLEFLRHQRSEQSAPGTEDILDH